MADSNVQTPDLLIFRTSGKDCAFPLDAVREIVPMATLFSPPGMPSVLSGFLGLRGTAVPILRLDRLFDIPEQPPGLHTPLIVLRGKIGPVGILAESVRSIVPVLSWQLLDVPADGTFRNCAAAVLQIDGESVHLLSPAALLDANEDRMVADYSAVSRSRPFLFEEKRLAEETLVEAAFIKGRRERI